VRWAEERASLGLTTQAEAAFARAAQNENPGELESYAKFMRRTGQLQRAFELNEQILTLPGVVVSQNPERIAVRSRALANMGLITRKQGDLRRSRELLDEAVITAREAGKDWVEALNYALDLRGITLERLGMMTEATTDFEESLIHRRDASDDDGQAKSLVNLARIARRSGDDAKVVSYLHEAIRLLGPDGPEPALANALASLAEALTEDSPSEAESFFNQALDINEQLKNSDGISVVSGGLAQLHIAEGDVASARRDAERAMEVSTASANREGIAVALRLMGQVEHAAGNLEASAELLDEAVSAATAIGDPNRDALARLALAKVQIEQGSTTALKRTIQFGLEAAALAANSMLVDEFQQLRSAPD
jgi:tetratricopeptide (TPR) repeat protein